MTRRAVVLCPGRGSYTAGELGYLSASSLDSVSQQLDPAIDRLDARRADRGEMTIREMDGAERFSAAFLQGENAASLTFACTAFDFLRLDPDRVRVVAVGGNSMGWYSALYGAGVLGLDDVFSLVETMGGMARAGTVGGQIIYPAVDEAWLPDEEAAACVDAALIAASAAGHEVGHSIRFGGFAVLWADDDGLPFLLEHLEPRTLGSHDYPFQLHGHSAFHSPLMQDFSSRGLRELGDLPWRAPALPLVDGRGGQWRPLSADPDELYDYTLAHQVVETFDFRRTVLVALREYAPELIVLLGPGDSLGGAVAHVLIQERWQGIDSRETFVRCQGEDPFLVSMARPDQAALVAVS